MFLIKYDAFAYAGTKIRKVERRAKRNLSFAETEYLRQSQRYEEPSAEPNKVRVMPRAEYLKRAVKDTEKYAGTHSCRIPTDMRMYETRIGDVKNSMRLPSGKSVFRFMKRNGKWR